MLLNTLQHAGGPHGEESVSPTRQQSHVRKHWPRGTLSCSGLEFLKPKHSNVKVTLPRGIRSGALCQCLFTSYLVNELAKKLGHLVSLS